MLLEVNTFDFDQQSVEMPWGETLEVAPATPPDAEHGAHPENEQAHDHEGHDHSAHEHEHAH